LALGRREDRSERREQDREEESVDAASDRFLRAS
jgi:hypothetical protein